MSVAIQTILFFKWETPFFTVNYLAGDFIEHCDASKSKLSELLWYKLYYE